MKYKIIIAGGRDFEEYEFLKQSVLSVLKTFSQNVEIEIVSGHARGADSLGERFAKEFKIPCKIFPADWNGLGRKAGIIRNHQMGDYVNTLIAFWDGKSHGTKDMIDYSKQKGLDVYVFNY